MPVRPTAWAFLFYSDMSNIQLFQYENTPMEFEVIDGQVFANATIMCQAFGRDVNQWRRLASTQKYADALCKNHITELFIVKQGGLSQGTWIHEKLILKLAQWLDVNFEIWCDEKIAELLRTGKAELDKPKEQLPSTYLEALKALVQSEEEKVLIQQKAEKAERTVAILMHVNKTFTATEISKELQFKSANELNKRLHEKGIQFKQNDTWVLYSKYANLGYVEIKQEVLDNGKVVYHRRFTQMGREFLLNLFEIK